MTVEPGKAMVWRRQGPEHTETIPVTVRKVGKVLVTVELADGSTRAVRPKRLREPPTPSNQQLPLPLDITPNDDNARNPCK